MEIRNVVVTGGLGFVGSAIVNAFHERYPTCFRVLDNYNGVLQKMSNLPLTTNKRHVLCDILDYESLASVLRHVKPEVVIHTAGIVPLLTAEKIVLAANSPSFSTGILRPSVVMGPGDHQIILPIHAWIAKGETPFIIGSADNLWDIIYVMNVADAHVLSAENLLSNNPTAAGEMVFILNNTPNTFRDFILAVWKEFGHIPSHQITIQESLAWTAGLLAEAASWLTGSREVALSRFSVNDACAVRYVNGKKARIVLEYEARVELEEGIRLSSQDRNSPLRVTNFKLPNFPTQMFPPIPQIQPHIYKFSQYPAI
ncbi:hypothetical protein EYC80_006660 [Monilinia laxa]|uniref:3-beta hydroxysteroid dehydrogenase/isomerase domain-containing protein n=1 Tax=Monilinia laxa TaxID=61186 RepID=A0A5N6JV72_MONLA|nr:hypothetical protein EYC80_006660 [Monilinia laxa]